MKKDKSVVIVLIIAITLILGFGIVAWTYLDKIDAKENPKYVSKNEAGLQTFADMTEREEFQNLPLYEGKGVKLTEPEDRGDNVYMVTVNGTDKEQYEAYLKVLEKTGFVFFADNGEDGLYGDVYTTSFTKDNQTVTVTYVVKEKTAYITSAYDMPLSPHLIYKDEYMANNVDGIKNTVTMMEMFDSGNSFIFQLKNGHFIISDGGYKNDTPYILDYLESLAPNGEKPVVEAWFVSHAHGDHDGALANFASDTRLLERVYIDGIYLSMPNDEAFAAVGQTASKNAYMMIQALPSFAKASDGTNTKIYRPQTGQQYYFCDVVVDIPHTQEQLITQDYANLDLNDSSVWTVFNMDGQKFLLSGDTDMGAMRLVMRTYDAEDFELDIYASFHHNLNNWMPFLEWITFKTTLFTARGTESQNKKVGEINSVGSNAWLKENSLDYYSWEDGGKVLIFPYEIGSAKSLPMNEWKYHPNRPKRTYE